MTEMAQRVVARFLKAKGVGRGETWENDKVRVHRYANSFRIWDLANAGKRGKKVPVMIIMPKGYRSDEDEWMERNARYLVLNAARGFDSIRRYFETLPKEEAADISERQERGIDVMPAGTRTIKLQWKIGTTKLRLEATPMRFSVVHSHFFEPSEEVLQRNPAAKGFYQDTMYYPVKKPDAKRFYGWLVGEGESKITRMDMDGIRKLWRQLGVNFDYH